MRFKTFSKIALLGLGLGFSSINFAQVSASLERDFMQTFAQCDANFFKLIKQHKKELSEYAPIIEKGNIAYFDTGDNSLVNFKKPLIINNIKIYSYYQKTIDAENIMPRNEPNLTSQEIKQKRLSYQSYYFWGFLTKEPNEKRVARKLFQFKFIPYGNLRYLQHDLISDIRKSQQWEKANIEWGYFPKPYSIERTMYINGESTPISLNCSIQGEITPKILKQIRPDL